VTTNPKSEFGNPKQTAKRQKGKIQNEQDHSEMRVIVLDFSVYLF